MTDDPINAMTFFRTFMECGDKLSAADRGEFYSGLLHYGLDGVIPDFNSDTLQIAFMLAKPNIDISMKKRQAGRQGGLNKQTQANCKQIQANCKQTQANCKQTQANCKQTASDKEKDKDKDINISSNPELYLMVENASVDAGTCFSFDDFWNMYGKKVEKKQCSRHYATLNEQTRCQIKNALPKYVAAMPDQQYRKHPLKWLKGQCWDDEIPAANEKQNTDEFAQMRKRIMNNNGYSE